MKTSVFTLVIISLLFTLKAYSQLTSVSFGIVDTLYKSDNTPCGQFKETLDAAINYAIGENSKQLAQCGYKFEYVPSYFDINDILSAMAAGKKLEKKKFGLSLDQEEVIYFYFQLKTLSKQLLSLY